MISKLQSTTAPFQLMYFALTPLGGGTIDTSETGRPFARSSGGNLWSQQISYGCVNESLPIRNERVQPLQR